MSRFRRLKDRRRKNRIKATSYGLALALAVGSAQGLCTYALFTDTEKVPSDLAISTGDVDVEIDKKSFNYDDVKPNAELKHEFKITNSGTLNQNIKLGLIVPSGEIPKEIYDCINSYKVEFTTNEDGNPGIVSIDNLKLGISELKVNDGSGDLFILSPGQSITCNVTIKMNTIDQEKQIRLSGQTLEMDLNVQAIQLDKNNIIDKGFYDIDIQNNSLTIGEANILQSGDALKVTPAEILGGDKTFTIQYYGNHKYMGLLDIIEKLDGDLQVDPKKISLKEKSGAFKDSNIIFGLQGGKVFEAYTVKSSLISDNFGDGNHIEINIEYKQNISKIYRIDFRGKSKEGNRLAEAKVTLLETVMLQEEQQLLKGDIELPTEPDVVEPPKEEIEKPSEPEVVEPPKEEVEVPSEPEVIEPPKENEEIQE